MDFESSSANSNSDDGSNTNLSSASKKLLIEPGRSPRGFDIVIGSYDSRYSGSGALHQYIARELGFDHSKQTVIFEEKGYRLLSVTSNGRQRILLGQVVSIGASSENATYLEENLKAFFRHLDEERDSLISLAGGYPHNIWIPTLGTGAAGLSQGESAHVIASVMSHLSDGKNSILNEARITLAPPASLGELELEQVSDAFGFGGVHADKRQSDDEKHENDAGEKGELVSEMPDHFHSDQALTDPSQDDLGRDAIAETIAININRVWPDQMKQKQPFAIHLAGRWGSGKSSILGFLEKKLTSDTAQHSNGWVVVKYNAWRMQDAGPPWWSLLTIVREMGYSALGIRGNWLLLKDWIWRNTRIAWPWIVTLLITLLIMVCFLIFNVDAPPPTAAKPAPKR